MTAPVLIVIDTNVFVSAALDDRGKPRQSVEKAASLGYFLFSTSTFAELVNVLNRPKLQKYLSQDRKEEFLQEVEASIVWTEHTELIKVCRDPDDDKFLEVAVSREADFLISGDKDLLVLHPFRGIHILTPADFLAEVEKTSE